MKFSHFFIERPVFATVLSLVILLGGGLALLALPMSQYPEIVPPTVEVTALYPGADPKVIADTVAHPDRTGGQRSSGHALICPPNRPATAP